MALDKLPAFQTTMAEQGTTPRTNHDERSMTMSTTARPHVEARAMRAGEDLRSTGRTGVGTTATDALDEARYLMADLFHLAAALGHNPAHLAASALDHYDAETREVVPGVNEEGDPIAALPHD